MNYNLRFLILLVMLSNCDQPNHEKKTKNRFSRTFISYTTGYHWNCELVQHKLSLDADSFYTYDIYCRDNPNSPYPAQHDTGKWKVLGDSVLILTSVKQNTWLARIVDYNNVEIFKKNSKEIENKDLLHRDTTELK